jgi:HD-GYP domain-containing protein (c-di-GMP phosphodiesterase class II)
MKIRLDSNLLESLLTLATVIEARDAYTGGHTWRVSRYSEELAKGFALSQDDVFVVRVGGLVHDIGKIGIPDAILNKPGPLTEEEFRAMREHPGIGCSVIENHPLFPLVFAAVAQHHKRPDGAGYPGQKSNEVLTIYGRIVAIADAFDAMTSTRPYRKGMEPSVAAAILQKNKSTQFDAALVERFVSLLDAGKLTYILGHANDSRLMLSCAMCGPIIAPSVETKDGQTIQCPHCTGQYNVHAHGDSFVLEATGIQTGVYTPRPDGDSVRSVLTDFRRSVHFAA